MAHDTNPDRDADTRGLAFVGQGLAFALLGQLAKKGVLTQQEAHDVLDTVLIGLEEFQVGQPGDQSVQAARAILDAMIETFRGAGSQPK